MVGLGETWDEVVEVLRDLATVGLPDSDHRPVPAPVARPPADGALLHAGRVPRAQADRARARFRPRRVRAARPQLVPRARADRGVRSRSEQKPASVARRSVGPPSTDVQHDIVACTRCPRLRTYCARIAQEKRAAYRDDIYWGRPVPGFGDPARAGPGARPGARRRTAPIGRAASSPATAPAARRLPDDRAARAGFANITTSQRADDGLMLTDAYIAAAVRCAPPDNKPTPAEIVTCHPLLVGGTGRASPAARHRRARQDRVRGRVAPARDRGISPERRPALRPRPDLPARRRPGRHRLLPPEPAEHEHEEADAGDAASVFATARRLL